MGCLFLNFTGGEIFTYKNFIEIYTYAKNKGFIIDLLTNASLIDNRLITVFKNLPPNSIAVTLYGTNEEDYLKNLYDFLDEFNDRYNDTVSTEDIVDLCQLARN